MGKRFQLGKRNPFQSSFMAQTAWRRLLYIGIVLVLLWLAVIWAVALP